jgi:hypothetical protein
MTNNNNKRKREIEIDWPEVMCTSHIIGPSTVVGAGDGVFTTVDIPKKANIGRYGGRLLDECEAQFSKSVYLLERRRMGKKGFEVVDGAPPHGNWLGKINQNKKGARNNLRINQYGFYKTTRQIKAGEELFVNYGPAYWKHSDVKRM